MNTVLNNPSPYRKGIDYYCPLCDKKIGEDKHKTHYCICLQDEVVFKELSKKEIKAFLKAFKLSE